MRDVYTKSVGPGGVGACGLNCDWCVYRRIEGSLEGCPGCLGRGSCQIRDCASETNQTCDGCCSHPCPTFEQGYACMREHYAF